MQPKHNMLRPLAQFFSYLFHPLFIPLYLFAFLIKATPELFANNSTSQQSQLLLNILVNFVFFPAVVMFLLKQLKFISSYYLHEQKERIIPIFAITVFGFWVWAFVLMKNPANYPDFAVRLGLAIFLTSSLTLVFNSFYKISLHTIGAGMVMAVFVALVIKQHLSIPFILLAAGIGVIIALSRKIAGRHSWFELYSGFMLGLLCTGLILLV